MYGTVDAELEVQRTIKRLSCRPSCVFSRKLLGPTKVHVDNKGIIDGLWRGESKCNNPKAKSADLWIKIREELYCLNSKEILVEVEKVKAHRTENEKTNMSHFEKFVTEGNEKADELA